MSKSCTVQLINHLPDSCNPQPTTAVPDKLLPVEPVSQPAALPETLADGEPSGAASSDEVVDGAIDSSAQTSASFVSDSAGSAMDESDDSSSDSSESSSESEDEAASSPAQVGAESTTEPAHLEPMQIDSSVQSAPRSSPSAVTNPSAISADESTALRDLSIQSQREMSAESDGYEPPEPETDAPSEGSSYSPPPFSPVLPGLVENTAISTPSSDPLQADEELTNTPQVSHPLPQPDLQVGAPGV